jgi:uncharacterized glyoxalase superfamily protein PhnB
MSDPTIPGDVRSPSIRATVAVVSIFCADHRALADWYSAVFGFAEITELTSPIFIALDAGGIALGFHHDDAYDLLGLSEERHGRGTKIHVTFDAGDAAVIDAAPPVLVAGGATVIKGPFTTYYGARQIVFADPEGNIMRLSTTEPALNLGRR